MSMIAPKRVVISFFISIELNIIQTQSRVFRGFKDRDKNRGAAVVMTIAMNAKETVHTKDYTVRIKFNCFLLNAERS